MMFQNVQRYIDEWKDIRDQLADYFRNKQKNDIYDVMLQQIEQFKWALYYCNNCEGPTDSVITKKVIDEMDYVPVNVLERLTFIEENPKHYQSYIQLRALFDEFEKIYARAKVMKKDQSIMD
ncbi:YpoC family protein [Salirhabdus salicampi]|uniref:YpoC family protein n=1 Tax=Salirhabdus salicampi TaxID=476102 RepID=UPI0020C43A89|nr:hypothetical protein [Salirhabdus salicampi]MCP8616665.1 hypothetical protein [Salirhabdus salicampi]